MRSLIAYLQLMRPANVITAIADILAGFAISGAGLQLVSSMDDDLFHSLLWLIVATIGLYGGGIMFNDVFDAELDKIERPERPIPSGRASVSTASIVAGVLLLIGIIASFQVSVLSGVIAIIVAFLAVLYNAWGKHQTLFGPINMGLCRGGNLLLGVSVIPLAVQELWPIAFIPVIYIAAITMISRGEVHGGNRKALWGGVAMYAIILLSIVLLSFYSEILWWQVLPFVGVFAFLIYNPLLKALRHQEPKLIGKAVKAGVLSLIVLNAALATVFAGWSYGLMVLLLLPISLIIAKYFSVT